MGDPLPCPSSGALSSPRHQHPHPHPHPSPSPSPEQARRDDLLRTLSEQSDTAAQVLEAELAGMDLPHALKACDDTQIPERLQEA